ncbi:MAG: peptidoglycan recognition family protein [Elusimicrobiota bacterium]|nr:peptidoglycan recognition family protein [Elusimicrobiota bacterium]
MNPSRVMSTLCAVALLSPSVPARAGRPDAGRIGELLQTEAASLGVQAPVGPADAPAGAPVPPPPGNDVETVETLLNFSYGDIVLRPERVGTIVRGRGRRRRTVRTGVTEADRVNQKQIRKIVIHASGGAGACEGTVNHLLQATTAAHFMVCRNGRVYQMVDPANIGNHVRNDAVDQESVGIETESAYLTAPIFRKPDWSADLYWPLYASLAGTIRAVAKEAGMTRSRATIITHDEADQGIAGAHEDPGPYFETATYPEFDRRYPGEGVTPREWLMRLVLDDTAPEVIPVLTPGMPGRYEVRDTQNLGLSNVRLWLLDAVTGSPSVKTYEWMAPTAGMPPGAVSVPAPTTAGKYRIVARDLVGNITGAEFRIEASAAGGGLIASNFSRLDLSSPRALAAVETGSFQASPIRLAVYDGGAAVGAP